jgi:hypothetical protein
LSLSLGARSAGPQPQTLTVKVGVIREAHPRDTISILDIPPADDFVAGARMALTTTTPPVASRSILR